MFVLEKLISWVAPHRCVTCGLEGNLVCDWCKPDFADFLPSRCAFCMTQTQDSLVCVKCRRSTRIRHLWVRANYDGRPKHLVKGYKFEHRVAAAVLIAELMAQALPFLPKNTIVTSVPTVTSHIRSRGYDHAELIAKELARQLGLEYCALLSRTDQHRQVGQTRKVRLLQLQDSFRLIRPVPASRPILLIDDILTTGGTMNTAANALHLGGAKNINGVVFAQKQ